MSTQIAHTAIRRTALQSAALILRESQKGSL